jgi:hypothetical protein
MTTAAEQKILADIAAAEARGDDVFGDEEEIVAAGPGDQDEGPDSSVDGEPEAKADEPATTDTPADEPPAQDEPAATEQPAMFKADLPADYKTQRTELLKAKAAAMKQLMDGEIDAEAFATVEAELADKLEDLTAQRIRAETLQEANIQNQAAYQQREIQKLIRASKSEVDYTKDTAAIKQFDQALAIISADPDNAGADYAELIGNAHKMVMALRGLKPPAAPATQRQPRGPGGEAPITLRSLPAASTPNVSGGVAEQLSRLSGPAYEAAFSKLSPAQRAQMLDEQGE